MSEADPVLCDVTDDIAAAAPGDRTQPVDQLEIALEQRRLELRVARAVVVRRQARGAFRGEGS